MKLVVISHKPCWRSVNSPTGYATDGGFPFQMAALSSLFDKTRLLIPCLRGDSAGGEISLTGSNLSVTPLTFIPGTGIRRKIRVPVWIFKNAGKILKEFRGADVVHAAIPGDIGAVGMVLAWALRKRLFVRYCGNWLVQRTSTERMLKSFMERIGSSRSIMLATGGGTNMPATKNQHVHWIFSTSLTSAEIQFHKKKRDYDKHRVLRITTVTRMEKGKGIDELIEAVPLLRKSIPRLQVNLVGGGSCLEYFKRKAKDFEISDDLIFHGRVDHERVLHILGESDLFCFATASEGFPKVVIEALACGLPVITSPVSVLPYLIGSEAGIVLKLINAHEIANAVYDCIKDSSRYRHMSNSALKKAHELSLERWSERIGEILRESWGPLRTDGKL